MADAITGLALLRVAFAEHQISKLPKGTKAQNECPADQKKSCAICGGWHHPKIIHLDYVGHAALTDRLLDADPAWTWEPLAMADSGLPVMDDMGGMWIKLTVCGVTRLGYGHAGSKVGGDAIKEVIGDALRNAAMRFGAALDLWHKGELHKDDTTDQKRDAKPGVIKSTDGAGVSLTAGRRADIDEIALHMIDCHRGGTEMDAVRIWYADDTFVDNDERVYCWAQLATESKLRAVIKANKPPQQA